MLSGQTLRLRCPAEMCDAMPRLCRHEREAARRIVASRRVKRKDLQVEQEQPKPQDPSSMTRQGPL